MSTKAHQRKDDVELIEKDGGDDEDKEDTGTGQNKRVRVHLDFGVLPHHARQGPGYMDPDDMHRLPGEPDFLRKEHAYAMWNVSTLHQPMRVADNNPR